MCNSTSYIYLNNQSFIGRTSVIDLNPDEYNDEWHYPFMAKLDVMEVDG